MYEKLCLFTEKHGNCLVPTGGNYEDKSLSHWVTTQRSAFKNTTLKADRIEKLDEIKFVWKTNHYDADKSTKQREWETMFEKLKRFKEEYGHCRVLHSFQKDPCLSSWVARQRSLLSSDRLHSSRKTKLDSVGFLWEISTEDRRNLSLKLVGYDDLSDHESEGEAEYAAETGHFEEESASPNNRKRKRAQSKENTLIVPVPESNLISDGKTNDDSAASSIDRQDIPLVGQRVAVFWTKDDEFYPGVISKRKPNGRVRIKYDDGDKEWMHYDENKLLILKGDSMDQRPDNPNVVDLQVGSRVSVWWQAEKEFFSGTLSKIKTSKLKPHRVKYDDGDKEWTNLAYRRFRY
jgi:hypothetical protein